MESDNNHQQVENKGVNVKGFYLLLNSIALRTSCIHPSKRIWHEEDMILEQGFFPCAILMNYRTSCTLLLSQ